MQTITGNESVAIDSSTRQNLRGVATNPKDGAVIIVGNAGTILVFDGKTIKRLSSPTTENLRAVSWNREGTVALVAGNHGVLLEYDGDSVQTVDGARANLRRGCWHPSGQQAVVASSCFADEFVPSPNLFAYESRRQGLRPLNEGRVDMIGCDWRPDGALVLLVGYDVIWHDGFLGTFDGARVTPVPFESKHVYPVGVRWKPTGELAALVTSTVRHGIGRGTVYLWDGYSLRAIYSNDDFFFTSVIWNRDGTEMSALASSVSRTFNC